MRSWPVFFAHWLVCYLGCVIAGLGGATIHAAMGFGGVDGVTWLDRAVRWQIGSLGAFLLIMGVTFALPAKAEKD